MNPARIAIGFSLLVLFGIAARVAWVAIKDKDRAEEDGAVSMETLARVRMAPHDRTDG